MSDNAQVLRTSLTRLGYRAADVYRGFRFAAVDLPARPVREVDAAAFLDGPASYRTAARGLVRTVANDTARDTVEATRSLGAPYLVVIEGEEASMWTYTANGATQLDSTSASQWQTLLADRGKFGPSPIRQLKALRIREGTATTGLLFDPRTLYAIQANTQAALDDMLTKFLAHFDGGKIATGQLSLQVHYEVLFPLVFRLLAGKILIDRTDSRVASVDVDLHGQRSHPTRQHICIAVANAAGRPREVWPRPDPPTQGATDTRRHCNHRAAIRPAHLIRHSGEYAGGAGRHADAVPCPFQW